MTESINQEPPADDLVAAVEETADAAIDDIRALGFSAEEISDEEIMDVLRDAVTAEFEAEEDVQ